MVNSSRHGLPIDIPASFLLWPQAYMPLLGQGWTLVHEMYFYAVFSLALFWAARRSSIYFVCWSALLVIAGFVNYAHPELLGIPLWKLVTHPLTFEFIGGVVIARLFVKGHDRFALPALLLGAILTLAASFMNPIDADPSWRRRALLYGIPALLILYGTVSAERRYSFRFPQLLLHTGDISYSVYLTHILVLVSIGRIWAKFHSAGLVDNVAVLCLMMSTAVAVGSISYRYLETPMQEFFSNVRLRVLQFAGASN
jgi:peptidoglycan/LPS O-acetylase OafA/YrhL